MNMFAPVKKFFKSLKQSKAGKYIADFCVSNADHFKSIGFVLLVMCLLELPDVLGAYIYGFRPRFSNAYIQALRIYFVIMAPVFFLPGKIGKIVFGIITLCLSFCALAVVILYAKYRLVIGGDCYIILFNSNPAETREFLLDLISPFNIAVILGAILFAGAAIFVFSRCTWKITKLHIATGILLLLPLSLTLWSSRSDPVKRTKVLSRSSLSKFIIEYNDFQIIYGDVFKSLTAEPVLPGKIRSSGKNIAGIIVIGESANRSHHSIYGYPRNTTPNLLRRKDSLLVFSDVISATIQTPTAIRYLLTDEVLSNSGKINYSLPDLFKAAGYETHWISNQSAWGLGGYESSTTLLAQKCDSYYFCHHKNPDEKYDIACVEPVQDKLNPEKPVILFIHLQGSHISYEYRYPESFGSFKNTSDQITRQALPENRDSTNYYDCSIEYTDFVLEKLINILEKQQRPTFLLYLSDHSECNKLDRHTVARSTQCNIRDCYEIPFLLWYSPEYKKEFGDFIEQGRKNLKAPLQGDRALWTIADISQISWDGFPGENSLFSPDYQPPRVRMMFDQAY